MKLSWISAGIVSFIGLCGIVSLVNSGCNESSNPTDPVSTWSASCSCTSNQYNCDSFLSPADAQLCYNHCISSGAGDIHDLDRDHDKDACEEWNY